MQWTNKQVASLKAAYERGAPWSEIEAMLPGRTRWSIRTRISEIGARRPKRAIDQIRKGEMLRAARLARIERAVELRAAGLSLAVIADRLGVWESTVRGYLPRRAKRITAITKEQRETAKRMYVLPGPMAEIVAATKLNRNQIIGLCHRAGLRRPERNTGRWA